MDINLSIDPEETITVIKEFIKTYVKNSGANGVVVGLSGGIDSAVTALLCKDALGRENTKCLFLPDEATPESDKRDQENFVNAFDISCETCDITSLVDAVQRNCIVKPDQLALANVKARLRMILLFEYANVTGRLVCGTSNKSELLIGYFTKYGDGGVDIMPIGDLYKTQVLEIARYLQIPEEIVTKPPTAGLYKGQTDEKEIQLKYGQLDKILVGLERKMKIEDIARCTGVTVDDVIRIKNMRIKTQHKRRLALIPKIGVRTPGLDWRSPILEG